MQKKYAKKICYVYYDTTKNKSQENNNIFVNSLQTQLGVRIRRRAFIKAKLLCQPE